MNMKQLRYVLVLAETGSFGKAADALGISQPSLSQYIKKIEQQLGLELFDRSGGYVRLTDAGRVYIEAGRKILDLEHQMQSRFTDLTEHKSGTLVIGTSPYRSAAMMPEVARRFQELYPGMHLTVEEMTSAELLEAAEKGQFDLCLTLLPADERIFCCEKLMEEEMVLAVPAEFPLLPAEELPDRKYPAVDAALLDGRAFVMITRAQFMQKALEQLQEDWRIRVREAAVVKSLEAQIAMVRAGVGLALVPTGTERFLSPGEVRFYSLKQALPRRQVGVIRRRDRELNQVTRDLLELMKRIEW